MQRWLFLLIVPFFLSACASDLDLDTDKKAATETVPTTSATTQGASSSTIDGSSVNASELARQKLQSDIQAAQKQIIYFDFDKYDVKPEYSTVIASGAQLLKANPSLKVDLQGNTDSRGSREYNLALGQRRADAVQQALQLQGANPSQIQAISFGKEKPAAAGDSPQDMALNRRVNFNYAN